MPGSKMFGLFGLGLEDFYKIRCELKIESLVNTFNGSLGIRDQVFVGDANILFVW